MKKSHMSSCLKGISFYKMPKIPYDKLFQRQSLINDCGIEEKVTKLLLKLLRNALFPLSSNMEWEKDKKSHVLFFFFDTGRASNERDFKKAASVISNRDVLIERHKCRKVSLISFYFIFILIPKWYVKLRHIGLTTIEKIQVLMNLTSLYQTAQYFEKIKTKKYKLLVTFYDSNIHECMLCLLFNKQNICTATLQHGQFNAWRESTLVNCGLEFYSSFSYYQLCWNKYAQEEAMKCGWSIERLPIVGILSNIGRGKERSIKPNNKIFGVVISHPLWEHENYEMIKGANILAAKYKMKYYLKLHPNYKEDYFKDAVDDNYYLGNVEKGIDTFNYVNMVDFSIVGSTSVFAEMVYFYHDILKYSTMLPSDKYRDIRYGNIFTKADNILDCYNNLNKESKTELFNYLCETDNTRKTYYDFFVKFT